MAQGTTSQRRARNTLKHFIQAPVVASMKI
jgi:hypothetical protein